MLRKFPSDKIYGTKNALFYLLRAPTHLSCTFNLRFLYELKHNVCFSKTVWGFSIFDSASFLLKIICSTKCMDWLTLKGHNSFQN